VPNTRATVQELFDGLDARSQNRWPSLGFDLLAVNDLLRPSSARGSTTRPSCGRGLLGKALRAADPPRRRAGRAVGRASDPEYEKAFAFATCW
jgi:methylglutamate dehydrogenase subunit C